MKAAPAPEKKTAAARSPGLYVLIAALAIVPMLPLTNGYFSTDDFAFVRAYSQVDLPNITRIFKEEFGLAQVGNRVEQYRPLVGLSFLIDYRLFGSNAAGYFVMNMALHALCSMLVLALARSVIGSTSWAPFFAAALFAMSVPAAASVGWVCGLSDLLVGLFLVAALLAFVRFWENGRLPYYAASVAASAAAMVSKEMSFFFPVIVAAHVAFFGKSTARFGRLARVVVLSLPFFLVLGAVLAIRTGLFGFGSVLSQTGYDEGRGIRGLPYRLVLGVLSIAFAPSALWTAVPGAAKSAPVLLVLKYIVGPAAIAALVYAGFLLWRRPSEVSRTVAFYLIVWYVLTVAPVAAAGYTSLRHFYAGSAGVTIAIGLCLRELAGIQPSWFGGTKAKALVAVLLLLPAGAGSWTMSHLLAGEQRILRNLMGPEFLQAVRRLPEQSVILLYKLPVQVRVFDEPLPFAIQPPFLQADVYRQYRILERPDLYGWPDWWSARRDVVQLMVSGQGGVYVMESDPEGHVSARHIPGARLREIYRQAAGTELPSQVGEAQARLLVAALTQ